MTIHFGTDHAGFALKEALVPYVRDVLGHEVVDCGAHELNPDDDYPEFIKKAAGAVSANPRDAKAIILGASGQGEAMVANKFPHVRAAVYYGVPAKNQVDATGNELDMIASTRMHNDANILSLGARFLSVDEAKEVVTRWLATPFGGEARHARRITDIDLK